MQSNGQAGEMEDAAGMAMDLAQVAYKLAAITELMDIPYAARELSREAYSGLRQGLAESAEILLNVDNSQGYKLLAVAALMETPEQAEEIGPDAWSGARLIIEDVTGYLLND